MKRVYKSKKHLYSLLTLKICALLFLFFLVFDNTSEQDKFRNSVYLLAVSDNEDGSQRGSIIELNLELVPGSGEIFIDLDAIKDVDTQVSIINSHNVACTLFDLDCENYDFYYDFEGTSVILKGPSASAAVAILTAKTMNRIKLDKDVTITGALSSGGVIGNVGGIDEKIEVAQKEKFDKVIVPAFSDRNKTIEYTNIEVIEAIDIIEAYNYYSGSTFALDVPNFDTSNYQSSMKVLSDQLCIKAEEYKEKINNIKYNENSSLSQIILTGDENYNFSLIANQNQNYYSRGSFCYSANLNYRIALETQKNLTKEEWVINLLELKDILEKRQEYIASDAYIKSLISLNDFYVYLLLNDRIDEALQTTESVLDLDSNSSNTETYVRSYSFASERLFTVDLWENLITGTGKKLDLSKKNLNIACDTITRQIAIKNEFLNSYEFDLFNDLLSKQNNLTKAGSNVYLCIYKGLELNGRIDTVVNSIGVTHNETEEFTKRIYEVAKSRLAIHSEGEFPLIPFIYFEYSGDLLEQEKYDSSQLYSNYALSYSDLNIILENQRDNLNFINYKEALKNSDLFIGVLILFILILQFF